MHWTMPTGCREPSWLTKLSIRSAKKWLDCSTCVTRDLVDEEYDEPLIHTLLKSYEITFSPKAAALKESQQAYRMALMFHENGPVNMDSGGDICDCDGDICEREFPKYLDAYTPDRVSWIPRVGGRDVCGLDTNGDGSISR